ncbi:MAG: hypothetical protein E4G90_01095 [Gemmatimonadales bacterium]|nr:MAG: hypothetical protein E4G90_01095 [Gemmatimonadales bacterium]
MLHVFGSATAEFDDLSLLPPGSQGPAQPSPPIAQPSQPPQATPGEGLPAEGLHWVRTGGPPGGLGYDIRYNLGDPDVWYATDLYGGVHISIDNGLTWQPSNNGIPRQSGPSGDAIPIFSLTVDPHDPQIIWAGTDPQGHIYKSTDGGASWTQKDKGVTIEYDGLSFRGFTVDPRSSSIVYAMAETIVNGNEQHGGVVYKTTNGGESWQVIWDGGYPSSLARYMWINPQDPDILYVSTGIFDRGAIRDDVYPWGGLGILKSTDGGTSWRILNEANGLKSLYIGSLFMHPENPDILLAGVGHNNPPAAFEQYAEHGDSPMGVYRTVDGGEHWTQVLQPPADRQEEFITSVEMCLSDPKIAYAGGNAAFYRSQDGGITWEEVAGAGGLVGWGPPGGIGALPIDLQCDPRDVNRIFANNYKGGNYLSEDGGRTWTNASTGYTGAQLITVAVDPTNPARVYSAGRNGAWRSDNGGTTWYGIINLAQGQGGSPEWAGLALDPVQPDRILMGGEGIFESRDGGKSWVVHPQSPQFGPFAVVIVFAPSDAGVVYAGAGSHNSMIVTEAYAGSGLAASRDGGLSWQDVTGDQFADAAVTGLAVSPENPQAVFAATQAGLFKTQDGGASWSAVEGIPNEIPVRTVAINPADPQWVLAGHDLGGLYLSQDGGETWQQLTSGLEPTGSYRDIVFDPKDPQIIYLGELFSGVYRSIDGGLMWQKINQGLTNRAVTHLSLSSDSQHLYAATNGEGVFRLDLFGNPPRSPDLPVAEEPSQAEERAAPTEATVSPAPPSSEDGQGFKLPCIGGALLLVIVGWVLLRRQPR